MAGLVPAIPTMDAQCPPKRDARHKAGHDGGSSEPSEQIVKQAARAHHGAPLVIVEITVCVLALARAQFLALRHFLRALLTAQFAPLLTLVPPLLRVPPRKLAP